MSEPLNLIDKALQYAKEERQTLQSIPNVISEPLLPKARRDLLYLQMRECIIKGCRKAVKLLTVNWKRSVAYSLLMQACTHIFHYKDDTRIREVYNKLMDDIIGTH